MKVLVMIWKVIAWLFWLALSIVFVIFVLMLLDAIGISTGGRY